MSHVKLKRLKINKYRNVRPGTELHFDDGVNLILGQNGSGKTTLLGLIAAVAGSDLSRLNGEAFDLEYELSNADSLITVHVSELGSQRPFDPGGEDAGARANEQIQDGSEAESRNRRSSRLRASQNKEPRFSHEARLTTAGLVYDSRGTPDDTVISAPGAPSSMRPSPVRAYPPSAPHFLLQLFHDVLVDSKAPRLELAYEAALNLDRSQIYRFDESLDTFLAMTGREPAIALAGVTPVSSFRATRWTERSSRVIFQRQIFTPGAFAPLVFRAHGSPGGEFRISPSEGESSTRLSISFTLFEAARRALGFLSIGLKPEIKVAHTSPEGGPHSLDGQGFSFNFTRSDGTTIHHDLLSYGQKRLLAFFYYLAATEDIVIADELVNGLHHRWIEACMKAIGVRQAFLTSQNPLLFDYVEFDSIEQVQARFITCKTEVVDGAEQLVWQNMARDDAARFYEAYTDEIEQVGEILITRGLW